VLLLQEITVAANEAASIEESLQVALDRVCEYTGWPVGHALLLDLGAGELISSAIWHLSDPGRFELFRRITEDFRFASGVGLPGRVLSTGEPAWIMDVNTDPNFPRAKQAKDIDVKAGFAFPVLAGRQVAAVLEFFSPEALPPDDRLLSVMATIGAQLGRAMERSRADEALRSSEEQYRLLFERNLAGVYRTTVDGRILACNLSLARIMGHETPEELLTGSAADYYDDPRQRIAFLNTLRSNGTVTNFEVRLRRKDGSELWALENATFLDSKDESGAIIEGTIMDITDRKRAEEAVRHMAYHDVLTGVPNRALFQDRFSVALAQARRTGQPFAVMSLDLDRFKLFNDLLGHDVGDELLKTVANRLISCLREGDTVARVGGDEFLILIPGTEEAEDAAKVAEKVLNALNLPIVLVGREHHAGVSIGISLYPHDGDDGDTLVKKADAAMYHAKALGRNNYQLYAAAMNVRASERLALESDLRRALDREELIVYYQPRISVETGRIVGAEALVRWRHPARGLVSPGEFIPIAEETGLIVRLGEWVLRTACAQLKAWEGQHPDNFRLSVNISMRQFQQPDFISMVERALNDAGIGPGLLELEITESIAMKDAEFTIQVLRRLRAMGIHISIDDFGTGYSSLKYLKDLPIDALKIDQSFIRDLADSENDAKIARNIIAMGHTLSLSVIAEGVESKDQLQFLKKNRCDEFQGFLCRKPVHPREFRRMFTSKKSATLLAIG
jgi:diguanylate cyclase (GGDEF)-like protein/PAS domain S-box-containing protein